MDLPEHKKIKMRELPQGERPMYLKIEVAKLALDLYNEGKIFEHVRRRKQRKLGEQFDFGQKDMVAGVKKQVFINMKFRTKVKTSKWKPNFILQFLAAKGKLIKGFSTSAKRLPPLRPQYRNTAVATDNEVAEFLKKRRMFYQLQAKVMDEAIRIKYEYYVLDLMSKLLAYNEIINYKEWTKHDWGYDLRRMTAFYGKKRKIYFLKGKIQTRKTMEMRFNQWHQGFKGPEQSFYLVTAESGEDIKPIKKKLYGGTNVSRREVEMLAEDTVRIQQKFCGIGKSHNVYCVGKIPAKVGSLPQKFGHAPDYVIDYITENTDVIDGMEEEYAFQVMVKGGMDTLYETLNQYPRNDRLQKSATYVQIMDALGNYGHLYQARKINDIREQDFAEVRYNKKAYPGYETSHTYEKDMPTNNRMEQKESKKADCVVKGIAAAYAYNEAIAQEGTAAYKPSIWKLGSRAKRQSKKIGEILKSRAIWMPEMQESMFNSVYAQTYAEAIKHVQDPLAKIGWTPMRGKFYKLYDKFKGKFCKAGDYSGYDTSMTRDLITVSFGIIRKSFPEGKRYDRIIASMCQHYLQNYLLLPGGYVVMFGCGAPSGTPWISIVNTICNFLIQITTLNELQKLEGNIKKREICLAMLGDDSLLGWKEYEDVIESKVFNKKAYELFGAKIKPTQDEEGVFDTGYTQTSQVFLGHAYPNMVPSRRHNTMVMISLSPPKSADLLIKQQIRMMYMIGHAPGNPRTMEYFEKYFYWCFFKNEPLATKLFFGLTFEQYIIRAHQIFFSRAVNPIEQWEVARYEPATTNVRWEFEEKETRTNGDKEKFYAMWNGGVTDWHVYGTDTRFYKIPAGLRKNFESIRKSMNKYLQQSYFYTLNKYYKKKLYLIKDIPDAKTSHVIKNKTPNQRELNHLINFPWIWKEKDK
jgi:hypothetical protein